uniref:Phorbol-ester/DAG-type domain-containing protein n=1 Tax=Rhabditophanes sp. KR3021 TaxID=114890 RepID=A0AC35TVW7_9BILA
MSTIDDILDNHLELRTAVNDEMKKLGGESDGSKVKENEFRVIVKDPTVSKTEFEDIIYIKGHRFVRRSSIGSNPVCETCTYSIWRMIQNYYRCVSCGYKCHSSCTSNVPRTCVSFEVGKKDFELIMKICPESSLSDQAFTCFDCKKQIAFGEDALNEAKLCDYTGKYYCPTCHWDDEMPIPARLVLNLDHKKRKVCRSSKEILRLTQNKPLIRLADFNQTAFKYLDIMKCLEKVRLDVVAMGKYFKVCSNKSCVNMLKELQTFSYFLEGKDLFSTNELFEALNGDLVDGLMKSLDKFRKHIENDCDMCKLNASNCSGCSTDQLIYAFDDEVHECQKCSTSYHHKCVKDENQCPRCIRLQSNNNVISLS